MNYKYGREYPNKTQVNKQAQTVDQNYANNILFMALSAL